MAISLSFVMGERGIGMLCWFSQLRVPGFLDFDVGGFGINL